MKLLLKFASLLLISLQLSAQTPEKVNVTLNREELKQLREIVRAKYRDTVTAKTDSIIVRKIDAVIRATDVTATVNSVPVKDLLTIAEKYLQDFIDVETKKKGRNSFIRIMRQIRQQDPNLRSMLDADGYIYRSREYVPLILDVLDKEKL